MICTGSHDRTAKVWRLPDLVLGLTLKGHKRGIWAVAFSPVDKAVATASGGGHPPPARVPGCQSVGLPGASLRARLLAPAWCFGLPKLPPHAPLL